MGSSRPNEWRYRAGAEADSGAGGGGSGLIPVLLFSFVICSVISLNFHLSARMKGRRRGVPPSSWLAWRRRGY